MSKIKIYEAGEQLNRIANALEEIIRMVKEDQERSENIWRTRRMTDKEKNLQLTWQHVLPG